MNRLIRRSNTACAIIALCFCFMSLMNEYTCYAMEGEATDVNNTAQTDTEANASDKNDDSIANISIDNRNKYDGMDRTYEQGYMPSVADGRAVVVVPVVCDGELKNNIIKTSLNLGDASSMPFVCRNYEKDVYLGQNKVNDGTATVDSYLISYTLELKSDRLNGSYPVILELRAQDKNGNNIEKTVTTYVTITDGKDPNEQIKEEVVEEAPTFAPKVLVESYEYSKNPVVAGDEIEAKITLYNTSKSSSVKNMTVTISAQADNLTLLSPTDTIYIERLGAGEKTVVVYTYKVAPVTPEGQYNLQLSMDYADNKGMTYSAVGNAKLNVEQPVSILFDPVKLEENLQIADVAEVSVNAMNLGKSKVYNVRASIDVDGLSPDGTIFIGDIEPGNVKSSSITVEVVGLSGNSIYGDTEGRISFVYEDGNGEEYTTEQVLSTKISSQYVDIPDEKKEDKPFQWWVIMGVIGAVLAAFAIMALASYIRRRKLEEEDWHAMVEEDSEAKETK